MNTYILIFSAFFILLGILIWKFPKLIAGYNTMSAEQQKKVDVKGLKSFISSIGIPVIGAIFILIGAQRYDHN